MTLIVPFAAGGPTDRVARDLADAMRRTLPSVRLVVENLNGAGGTTGAAKVAHAAADGRTLLLWHIGMAAAVGLYRKLPFRPLEDFEYLGLINEVPMSIVGRPQLPVARYADLEAMVRAQGPRLNIAHAGLGSASHLCGLLWQAAIDSRQPMTTIPFGGTAPAMAALVAGQVDVMCDQTTNTAAQIEAGRVKAFAVTSATRLSHPISLKDTPTLQESGHKGVTLSIWHGLYAPRGTPPSVLRQLNQALKAALRDPEFVRREEALGAMVVTDGRSEPAGHKAFVAAEIDKLKPLIDAAGRFAD